MANEPTTTTICIDIGMTASAASWKDNHSNKNWNLISSLKIPTRLAYDAKVEDGPPVAWGEGCADLPQQTKIREYFKASMDERYSPNTNLKSTNLVAQAKIQCWMRDYMHLFCEHIAANIGSMPGVGPQWKEATINWIFTVPGSWAQLPTVANFKRLAEEAIYCCIGDNARSKVFTNITEARAAAQCLLKNGSATSIQGYTPGNTVLSCDIGGATTDIAVSQIEAPGLLKTPLQLDMHPEGMMNVDIRFIVHFQQTLESAGVPDPLNVAQKMFKTYFLSKKYNFTGREKDNWITCQLPLSTDEVRNWPSGENISATGTRIQDSKLLIHKNTIIDLFADFVEGIEATIDAAINRLAQNGVQLTVIGLCGGGSRIVYPIQRLRQRYEDKMCFLDHRDYSFRPEMATLIGSMMLLDQQTVIDFCNQMRFGIKKGKDDVFWGNLTEIQTPSSFESPYAKEVKFMENTRTLHASINHDLIVVPWATPTPQSFSEGCFGDRWFEDLESQDQINPRRKIASVFEQELQSNL